MGQVLNSYSEGLDLTEAQFQLLFKLGMDLEEIKKLDLTKGEASDLIQKLRNKVSKRQLKKLLQLKVPDDLIQKLDHDGADSLLAYLFEHLNKKRAKKSKQNS